MSPNQFHMPKLTDAAAMSFGKVCCLKIVARLGEISSRWIFTIPVTDVAAKHAGLIKESLDRSVDMSGGKCVYTIDSVCLRGPQPCRCKELFVLT